MSTIDVLEQLFDAAHLSTLLGRAVRPTAARVKAGVQVTIGLGRPTDGRPVGWARALWPVAHDKGDKIVERAARWGQSVVDTRWGELRLQAGHISSDPLLAKPLRSAPPGVLARADDPSHVLRYNPLRRVLVRDGAQVVRVAVEDDPVVVALLGWLAARDVPVPLEGPAFEDARITARAFVGDGDLAARPSLDGMAWAGHALAELHSLGPAAAQEPVLAGLAGRPTASDPRRLAADLATLDADLGRRAHQVAERLAARPEPVGPTALLHGDASADQILQDSRSGQRFVNDFDRATLGAPAHDLGSWLAAGSASAPEHHEAFLGAYAERAGGLPTDADLATAHAGGLFSRVMTPLREAEPRWRTGISDRLDAIEQVLR